MTQTPKQIATPNWKIEITSPRGATIIYQLDEQLADLSLRPLAFIYREIFEPLQSVYELDSAERKRYLSNPLAIPPHP